jgi:tripartite-type tricarboxylate transporter receptor subunit TctC
MKLPRRNFLHLAAAAAVLPAVSRIAWAQAYPSRPVHIIVGFAPAGGIDIVARLIGQWLQERLGQPFIVENRPGAASNIATEAVVRAAADGYTLLFVSTPNAINTTLYEKLNFNFIRDVAPVAGIMVVPNVMVVHPSVPAKTVPEFITHAKANPGKVNLASGGVGGPSHVAGELFKMMAGVGPRTLSWRRAGTHRSDRGTSASHILHHAGVDRIHQGRQAACARRNHRDARGSAPRHSDRGRIRAGLRGERVVWHRRAQENAD